MTSARPARTEIGKPLPSALPIVVRSGVTPKRAWAPPGPWRKPVITSSKIRSVPAAVQASRSASRKPGSGSTTPALWKTGSTITAAIVSPSLGEELAGPPAASLYSRTTTRSRIAAGIPAEAGTGVGWPPAVVAVAKWWLQAT